MSKSLVVEGFSYLKALIFYLFLRFRQIVLYSWVTFIYFAELGGNLKQFLVQNMFWGRSSLYRSLFQFSVGFLTIIIGIGGLTGRLSLFDPEDDKVLAFPKEQLGDADYLDESGSIQAVVASSGLSRDFDIQTYIVQRGDTLSAIANKFDVSEDTVRWANKIKGDYIKIGQKLEILPINGVVHKVKKGDTLASIGKKYKASVQDIYDINWLDSKVLKPGQELLVPNGRMPQPKPVQQAPVATTSTSTTPTTPTPPAGPTGYVPPSGNFVRPATCGGLTNYYSAWHRGVDIAGPGCNIVAADSGVVTMARWYGSGGLQIIINHGNGYQTLYAHHSAIYVKEGQRVTRGQPIGKMGCTGACTGTHLHFGVAVNGVYLNPLNYVPI